ncbi:DNA-binding transcriptional regulator, LacI/PurR family [Klenkia soli]|uniref:DNA-binding transcriptional regulator, LacI/PurR family n=1 Tax=Klenkia soli TaxID=1052260 RepID=A0A1H0KUA2_9ACTN|nr:LacI family DNA-binding transcriptional regulator [Klenkia soli]SDO59366.1 DNA-binding transcriptional regulator, LacI/PurR family [Klenkia soli]
MSGTGRTTRRVTSADVAREAGVSRTTVSFVLNDTPGKAIPEETRQRVWAAADRLAYTPSAEARALSRGRSDVVLLLVPADLLLSPHVGAMAVQLAGAFAGAGLQLVAHLSAGRPGVDAWAAVTPAAVVAWDLPDDDAEQMRRSGVQVVASFTGSDVIGSWVTGAREAEVARLQVQRLAQAGHRHLGYAVPDDERTAEHVRLRSRRLRDACGELGLPDPVQAVVPAEPRAAADAVAGWRTVAPQVTGVCAHDATTALSVLAGAHRLGLAVPADLALVGVDDVPAAAVADPPLTMVDLDPGRTAEYMVAVVTALLAGEEAPGPGPSVARLVERSSV